MGRVRSTHYKWYRDQLSGVKSSNPFSTVIFLSTSQFSFSMTTVMTRDQALWNKALFILFCLTLPVFLLLLSYKLTLAFYPLTPPQENTLNFLHGQEMLTVPYAEQELSHLRDVQKVMDKVDFVFYLLLIAVVSLFSFSWRAKTSRAFLRWGGLTTLAVVGIVLLFLLLSFTSVFTLFHQLFFPQGNWLFPEESLLIRTFPQEFFVKVGLTIFLLAVFMGLCLLILSSIKK